MRNKARAEALAQADRAWNETMAPANRARAEAKAPAEQAATEQALNSARRAALCVAACQGVPAEELTPNVVADLLARLRAEFPAVLK